MIQRALKVLFAVFFIGGGIAHFAMPDFYLKIMPPYLPWHLGLVYLSGVIEIVLGIALLFRTTQNVAAWGLIALLIAVFPANLHMYFSSAEADKMASLIRLPFQLLFILWAFYYTKKIKL